MLRGNAGLTIAQLILLVFALSLSLSANPATAEDGLQKVLRQPPAATVQPPTVDKQRGRVFAMGVNFGISSYFGSALACCEVMRTPKLVQALENGLSNVNTDLLELNAAADASENMLPGSDIQLLKAKYAETREALVRCPPSKANRICDLADFERTGSPRFQRLYAKLVELRDSVTARFAKLSKPVTDTYVFGVNMGIAEGHASQGETGRPVVYSSLTNAKTAAQQLGMDTSQLEALLSATQGSTPMPEIAVRLGALRASYQVSF